MILLKSCVAGSPGERQVTFGAVSGSWWLFANGMNFIRGFRGSPAAPKCRGVLVDMKVGAGVIFHFNKYKCGQAESLQERFFLKQAWGKCDLFMFTYLQCSECWVTQMFSLWPNSKTRVQADVFHCAYETAVCVKRTGSLSSPTVISDYSD